MRVAYHEAGHAVVAFYADLRFRRATIIPNEDERSLGHVLFKKYRRGFQPDVQLSARMWDRLDQSVVATLAGALAEKQYAGRFNHGGARSDRADAVDLAYHLNGGNAELVGAYLRWARLRAQAAVQGRWKEIAVVAAQLLVKRTLTYQEVRAAIDAAYGFTPLVVRAGADPVLGGVRSRLGRRLMLTQKRSPRRARRPIVNAE